MAFHQHTEPANNATGAAPHGQLADIVGYYQSLHPARLAITGEPGAGKILHALDLLLGLLTHPGRTDTDPAPVRFSLAGWDTDRPLQEWLAHQVHQQFRNQGITLADAAVLVDRHRVLPILDEMDTDATPAGRRRAAHALQELNKFQVPTGSAPVILTWAPPARSATTSSPSRRDQAVADGTGELQHIGGLWCMQAFRTSAVAYRALFPLYRHVSPRT
ncbi:hypothetical protein [Streptomyces sp. NPDC050759]|uniref:hypothetical protein n=1 Tax=Streptomyces sp. NPDC050759 TaxID=3365635 RepID=UPI0037B00222